MTRFANRPCEVCKKDTMHYVSKCSECGNCIELALEAKARMRKRRFQRFGPAFIAVQESKIAKARKERMIKDGYTSGPGCTEVPIPRRRIRRAV